MKGVQGVAAGGLSGDRDGEKSAAAKAGKAPPNRLSKMASEKLKALGYL